MNNETEGRAAAARFRREHRLGVQPLGDLVAIIDHATAIDVAVLDAGADEHGLTMRDPVHDAIFIGIARTRNPMRQRSTLAHELGHVVFQDWARGHPDNWSDRTPVEVRADAFARHLLAPVEGVREFLGNRESMSLSTLSEVVQRFLVSPAIAAIALHQADYIDDATKLEWMRTTAPQLAARYGWIDQYRALQADSDRRRAPQRLLARAIKAYEEEVLSAQAIATLRGITVEDAQDELREAGIEPVRRAIAWTDAAELPDVDVDLSSLDEALGASGDEPIDVPVEEGGER